MMISRVALTRHKFPFAAKNALRQHAPSISRAFSHVPQLPPFSRNDNDARSALHPRLPLISAVDQRRLYSSRADIVQSSPGRVTKSLRVLDMDTVKTILEELRSVDVNADGRYDMARPK